MIDTMLCIAEARQDIFGNPLFQPGLFTLPFNNGIGRIINMMLGLIVDRL